MPLSQTIQSGEKIATCLLVWNAHLFMIFYYIFYHYVPPTPSHPYKSLLGKLCLFICCDLQLGFQAVKGPNALESVMSTVIANGDCRVVSVIL